MFRPYPNKEDDNDSLSNHFEKFGYELHLNSDLKNHSDIFIKDCIYNPLVIVKVPTGFRKLWKFGYRVGRILDPEETSNGDVVIRVTDLREIEGLKKVERSCNDNDISTVLG